MDEQDKVTISDILGDAVSNDDVNAVKELLRYGDLTDYQLMYALDDAAFDGKEEIVKLLLAVIPDYTTSPLSNAAFQGDYRLVESILDYPIDNYDPAIAYASGNGHYDVVKLLIDNGADNLEKGLITAAHHGHNDIIHLLIENGADNLDEALGAAELADQEETEMILKGMGARSSPFNQDVAREVLELYY